MNSLSFLPNIAGFKSLSFVERTVIFVFGTIPPPPRTIHHYNLTALKSVIAGLTRNFTILKSITITGLTRNLFIDILNSLWKIFVFNDFSNRLFLFCHIEFILDKKGVKKDRFL
ncbi:MAG: hypothetical protein LBT79_03290 [Elusimicrobiota bacterium]|jgi:hypothetical protein|nr:hypothetical protein [Elusimicrobiota bacterium]